MTMPEVSRVLSMHIAQLNMPPLPAKSGHKSTCFDHPLQIGWGHLKLVGVCRRWP